MIYSIQGETLKSVDKIRDLGVILTQELNFEDQYQLTSSQARPSRNKFYRNRRILYFSLVRSHIDFASTVWGTQGVEHSTNIERIQKRSLK
jgi:hypothetical protein